VRTFGCVCLSVGLSVCLSEPLHFQWKRMNLGILGLLERQYVLEFQYVSGLKSCVSGVVSVFVRFV